MKIELTGCEAPISGPAKIVAPAGLLTNWILGLGYPRPHGRIDYAP
jgi:hypothetical protein